MTPRDEELTVEAAARQAELERSWSAARLALADPKFRQSLEGEIARVNGSRSTEAVSREQFLAATEPTAE
ncbi:MAG: hypothetical protein AAGA93_19255 [Actinomycetota bacterium]